MRVPRPPRPTGRAGSLSPEAIAHRVGCSHAALAAAGPRDTVGNIAFRSGFDNPVYFAHLFYQRFGMRPSDVSRLDRKESGGRSAADSLPISDRLPATARARCPRRGLAVGGWSRRRKLKTPETESLTGPAHDRIARAAADGRAALGNIEAPQGVSWTPPSRPLRAGVKVGEAWIAPLPDFRNRSDQ